MHNKLFFLRGFWAISISLLSIAAYAQPNKGGQTSGRLKESSLPDEWRVAASSAPYTIKQGLLSVDEANDKNFKTIGSFGKSATVSKLSVAADDDSKVYKFIILFNNTATWAAPLKENKLMVVDDMNTILVKYHLVLDKWYDAQNGLEGLVVRANESGVNVLEAARELSKVSGVEVVHLKAPK